MEKTCWKNLIEAAMAIHGESFADMIAMTLTDEELTALNIRVGHYGPDGCPFTLWTKRRVYFPVTYDGYEWVESVPRRPCKEETSHVGG